LNGRLEEDPPQASEMEDVISPSNNWEKNNSDLDYRKGTDLVEIRLVNNRYCRENGWRDAEGHEHWDRSKAWSLQCIRNNVGYRFVRFEELGDATALLRENTPLVMDGVACVSEQQFKAVRAYLAAGGIAWIAPPFGTHDEKGFKRNTAFSEILLRGHHRHLVMVDSAVSSTTLEKMIADKKFRPVIRQLKGDPRWALRIRTYAGKSVIHFMSAGLFSIPDDINDLSGIPLMKDIDSKTTDNDLSYAIDMRQVPMNALVLMSPELGENHRPVKMESGQDGRTILRIDLDTVKIYAVAQR
jgi:hypothetical protein